MGRWLNVVVTILLLLTSCASSAPPEILASTSRYTEVTELPPPTVSGEVSLEHALRLRRSVRSYIDEPLTTEVIGQLLWAGQGTTDGEGHRTAPSAGALYPLELYVVTDSELMHYIADGHRIEVREDSTSLAALGDSAFGQDFVSTAPAVMVIAGVAERTEEKYGALARDLVNREAGHAAQNILLQAVALDLAAVPVGGFDPAAVSRLLALPDREEVLYLLPVGLPSAT